MDDYMRMDECDHLKHNSIKEESIYAGKYIK